MRVAIPVTQGRIAPHLGHCEYFYVAEIEDGKVVGEGELPNPGHGPGGPPPVFVARLGVGQVLAWGMPDHALGMFNQMGVKVLRGVTGDPKQALAAWLNGTLTLTTEGLDAGNTCEHG